MSINWGPYYIVPSESTRTFSGRVLLRESFDEELLKQELKELGCTGVPVRATNPWYYRKRDTESWIKIGESSDQKNHFAVAWDTTALENGQYQIQGLMHVFVKIGEKELAIARQNIIDVKVEN